MPLTRVAAARRGLVRIGVWNLALTAFALLITWAILLVDLAHEHNDTITGAERETSSFAAGVAETTAATFDLVDHLLLDLRDDYSRDKAKFELPTWPGVIGSNGLVLQAAIVAPDGMMLQSNLPAVGLVDLSDREHIRYQKASTDDRMFISKPVLGRVSNRKTLNITRKMVTQDGRYDGAVVVSVGLDYLARFYAALSTGGVVALVGSEDGIVRSRAPVDNALIGSQDPYIERMVSSRGTFQTAEMPFWPGKRPGQFVSYVRLARYPLIVTVALDARAVFAPYDADVLRDVVAGCLLSLLFLIGGTVLARQRIGMIESRTALTATLENITQGIMMVDATGHVPVINRRAIELLKLPKALVERNPTFREIITYQLAMGEFGSGNQADAAFVDLVRSGGMGPEFAFYERVRADGTALEIRTLDLPDGGVVRTFTDVTARKRNEEALASARDAAEAGLRSRSQFIAVMSHEIRTPMNGILGVVELLQTLELSPAAQEYANIIKASANHLYQIITDILDYSRLNAGGLELEAGVFDVRETVREVTWLVAHQANAKGLTVTCDIADDFPPRLFGDAQRLRQILLNLAGNAVKFTQEGAVNVSVRRIRDEDNAIRLGFSVTDSGIGISTEGLGRLFQEFSQVDNTISRRFGGSGLGLVITRQLVELMDGHISVESVPGAGSTFRFDVRLRRVDAAAEAAPLVARDAPVRPRVEPPSAPSAAGPSQDTGAGWRILLAEDGATNRFVATRMLERLGHRVESVEDGLLAVEAVKTGRYDLVLMDMMMPNLDGLAATRLIRQLRGGLATIPVIGLTANAMESDRDACMEAGMDGFVTKPINTARLGQAMDEVMQTRRRVEA